jgi:probable HAF family extracellular repeat protein
MNFFCSLSGKVFALVSLMLVSAQAAEHRPPARYFLRDLGTLPGGSETWGNDINNRGQIVGSALKDSRLRFRYYPVLYRNGRLHDLGLLPGANWGFCGRINDRGQMLGYQAFDGLVFVTSLLYTRGKVIDLSGIIGTNGFAAAINNHGVIAGTTWPPGASEPTAFALKDGVLAHLGTLTPGRESSGSDINDSGDAVGYSWAETDEGMAARAVLFSHGEVRDLGTLPGWEHSQAIRINRKGHIIGHSSTPNAEYIRSFIYRNGVMRDIGTLPGGTDIWTRALAINGQDHVVGNCIHLEEIDGQSTYVQRPFLYIEGRMWDLNRFIPRRKGWKLVDATGINDRGQIIAIGEFTAERYQRTCLLTPIRSHHR